ncbi:MAG: putative signal peptide peptidase SppA [Candidatus Anoxychlamydiales bacterium]|nr:putative signal peptide peptidase SppA [Candidatus Anoxychlamydiales bacterium]
MKVAKESIFISAIRAFFNTLLGTFGVFVAIIPSIILFAILSTSDQKQGTKNKLEILPDLNGSTKMLSLNTPAILQLEVHGVIGTAHLTSKDVNFQLIESRKGILKNDRVKALLLHINSPGGAATDSDTIYRNILAYKERYNVPVYAYVDGMCASGGFFIACAADQIYTSPFSMIGSVGSLMGPFFNFYNIMEKYGVKSLTITAGKDKDMLNPFREWKTSEDQNIQKINEYVYKKFVDIVATSRNIDKDKIINEYGAHVFDSDEAKEIGYTDVANSSYEIALTALLEKADIDETKNYQVVCLYPKKIWYQPFLTQTKSFFKSFLKEFLVSSKYINTN